ncbi:unnamed protein product, partial [Mesorhabditis belari]|uniref:Uncharacterized protein n=1 Tax=Mesorhabditis belari TaxID=2138241 RepID=A0AAF3FQI2_9BILA
MSNGRGSALQVQRQFHNEHNNHSQQMTDESSGRFKFNPERQFYLLKLIFGILCIIDITHWGYLLRDDNASDENTWKFYIRIDQAEMYYLIARMFGDIFVCVLGLGAAMWTRKSVLTVPCIVVQLIFVVYRSIVWPVRHFRGILKEKLKSHPARTEDIAFILCEFMLPMAWGLLSVLIVRTMRVLRQFEQLNGYAHPPVIVLTVKNEENDESVQIELA